MDFFGPRAIRRPQRRPLGDEVHRTIVSFTVEANRRSRAVMERIGMHRDPNDDFDHPGMSEGHPLRRHVLYRLTRHEWVAGRVV
jgi:RimJ/RimL family protein N-acetyltransferase